MKEGPLSRYAIIMNRYVIAVIALLLGLGAPVGAADGENVPTPLPAWVDRPEAGLTAGGYYVGIGASQVKPDMKITRAIAYARAAADLYAVMRTSNLSMRREYNAGEAGTLLDDALKTKTFWRLPGFCAVRTMLREYAESISNSDDHLVEQALQAHCPMSALSHESISSEEHYDRKSETYWVRVYMGGGTAKSMMAGADTAPGMLKYAKAGEAPEGEEFFWIESYSSEISGRGLEVYLKVRMRSEHDDMTWEEDGAESGRREAKLIGKDSSTDYIYDHRTVRWLEYDPGADYSDSLPPPARAGVPEPSAPAETEEPPPPERLKAKPPPEPDPCAFDEYAENLSIEDVLSNSRGDCDPAFD